MRYLSRARFPGLLYPKLGLEFSHRALLWTAPVNGKSLLDGLDGIFRNLGKGTFQSTDHVERNSPPLLLPMSRFEGHECSLFQGVSHFVERHVAPTVPFQQESILGGLIPNRPAFRADHAHLFAVRKPAGIAQDKLIKGLQALR